MPIAAAISLIARVCDGAPWPLRRWRPSIRHQTALCESKGGGVAGSGLAWRGEVRLSLEVGLRIDVVEVVVVGGIMK